MRVISPFFILLDIFLKLWYTINGQIINICLSKNIDINEDYKRGEIMIWWIIGITVYAGVLFFGWALCATASRADREMEELYRKEFL